MGLIITEKMAKEGGVCPVCNKFFVPNGIGPTSLPELTSVLNKLPSSNALKYGARFHDWCYHFADNWGTRLEADKFMLEKNKQFINEYCCGVYKTFYHAMNYRNYLFVRLFGQKIWDQKDCVN